MADGYLDAEERIGLFQDSIFVSAGDIIVKRGGVILYDEVTGAPARVTFANGQITITPVSPDDVPSPPV